VGSETGTGGVSAARAIVEAAGTTAKRAIISNRRRVEAILNPPQYRQWSLGTT
jgi:hypothetical protein